MSSYSLSSSPANEPPPETSKFLSGQPSATTTSLGSSIPFHHLKHLNQSMVSGAGAGLISSVVTCPLDVLKTRLQAQEIGKGKVGYEGVLGTSSTSSFLLVLLRLAFLVPLDLRIQRKGLLCMHWTDEVSLREAQLGGWRSSSCPNRPSSGLNGARRSPSIFPPSHPPTPFRKSLLRSSLLIPPTYLRIVSFHSLYEPDRLSSSS